MRRLKRLFGIEEPTQDLRIIIARHGERADLALGQRWAQNMQRNGGYDPRIPRLTPRASFREWQFDPPITVAGENQSASVGRKLLQLGYPIDYCYSSPAYRSIQTANKILESQGQQAVPINIEPGLSECYTWQYGGRAAFIPPHDLAKDKRFNINSNYQPIYNTIDQSEDERGYYRRSRYLIDEIVRIHKNHGGTILLSAHAGSIETVTRGLRGLLHRRGGASRLIKEAGRVNYCNFAILERDGRTGNWTVRSPESHNRPYPVTLSKQSIIPLYGISTLHVNPSRPTEYVSTRASSPRRKYYSPYYR